MSFDQNDSTHECQNHTPGTSQTELEALIPILIRNGLANPDVTPDSFSHTLPINRYDYPSYSIGSKAGELRATFSIDNRVAIIETEDMCVGFDVSGGKEIPAVQKLEYHEAYYFPKGISQVRGLTDKMYEGMRDSLDTHKRYHIIAPLRGGVIPGQLFRQSMEADGHTVDISYVGINTHHPELFDLNENDAKDVLDRKAAILYGESDFSESLFSGNRADEYIVVDDTVADGKTLDVLNKLLSVTPKVVSLSSEIDAMHKVDACGYVLLGTGTPFAFSDVVTRRGIDGSASLIRSEHGCEEPKVVSLYDSIGAEGKMEKDCAVSYIGHLHTKPYSVTDWRIIRLDKD